MSFDFSTYLQRLDPRQPYHIAQLTGGVINVTVRATKRLDYTAKSGRFPEHKSLIVKYAPPFVAGVGEEATLTQSRQVTEASVLSLFAGPLAQVRRSADVKTPNLLYHDPVCHIIVMSDLGQLPSLSDSFSRLGGYTPKDMARLAQEATGHVAGQDDEVVIQKSYYTALGTRLGTFFAYLHSQKTLRNVSASNDTLGCQLSNSELSSSVYDFAIKPLEAHFDSFQDLISVPESASTLYARIEQDWLRPTADNERSFILGDCWTGAALVSPPALYALPSEDTHPDIGIIDWEFATVARGPHGDIPQFLAHLELFRHAALWRNSKFHVLALDTLIASIIRSYRGTATVLDEVWVHLDSSAGDNASKDLPHPSSIRARIIRSALLAFASELLNCAFWKVWPCLSPSCPALVSNHSRSKHAKPGPFELKPLDQPKKRQPSFQTYSSPPLLKNTPELEQMNKEATTDDESAFLHDEEQRHLCPLIRRMAESAIWLTTHAGKDEAEMCQRENWEELVYGLPSLSSHDPTDCRTSCDKERRGDVHYSRGQSMVHMSCDLANCEVLDKRLWLLDLFT